MTDIKPGDTIAIADDADLSAVVLRGQRAIVDEVRPWGVQAYVVVDEEHDGCVAVYDDEANEWRAYVRLKWEEFTT